MTRVAVRLRIVGSCRHPACMVTGRFGLRQATFPALVAEIAHPTRGTILFDTGYGDAIARSRDPVGRLYRRLLPYALAPGEACVHQLAAAGIAAGDVHAVVLSHLHPDHAGGLRDFPGAPVFLSRDAYEARAPAGFGNRARAGLIRDLYPDDLGRRARFFEDAPRTADARWGADFAAGADLFGDGSLVAIPLPGHAAGQYGLRMTTTAGPELFLAADAVWLSVAYRELLEPLAPARAFTQDYPAYRATMKALHDFARARPDVLVVPSHCGEAIETARLALG